MASPSVAGQAVSSNEFGYLNAVVEDATHTIYEAQAWASGYRGSQPVFGEDDFNFVKDSEAIETVSISEATFKDKVGSRPGLKRVFSFDYSEDNTWLLTLTTTEGETVTKDLPEAIGQIEDYGIVIGLYGGYDTPNAGDNITITIKEHDNTFQNNAKYYAELANERKQAIEDLTASAEKIYADDFYDDKSYTAGTYVWHNKYIGDDPDTELPIYQSLLYRFIVDHEIGPWDETEVIEEILIEKDTLSSPAHFHFKVPQGPKGDVNFVTFDVDTSTGQLVITTPEYLEPKLEFSIQSPTEVPYSLVPGDGNLFVEIL